ncbi:MAG: phosphate ABC transporter permease PstA, partial [Propionicimonas sp.]|nr:phosphate ABC transporter permease PstA [Propionicimonas sp.]
MTTTVRPVSTRLTSGRLPRWFPTVAALVAVALGFVLSQIAAGQVNLAAVAVSAFVLYLVIVEVAARVVEGARQASDRRARTLISAAFVLALVPLVSLLWDVVTQGIHRFDLQFFTYSMRNVVGEGGGAAHAIAGTLWVTGFAALISIPIGLMTAIYLSEYGNRGRLASSITFFVDVMTGIPSIVAGLFAYALMAIVVGPGASFGFSGSVALSVLMIPVVVRSCEELLRLVPNELREASYALGVPKWKTILRIVIPTSISGLISGIILAIARVIGETAPLMIAAGFTASLNNNPFANPMMTLSVFVYDSYKNPGVVTEPYTDRAWTGALTLILIVMLLNLIGR